MTAAAKGTGTRSKRASANVSSSTSGKLPSPQSVSPISQTDSSNPINDDDVSPPLSTVQTHHPRPGTSTGYEGDNGLAFRQISGSNPWPLHTNTNAQNNYSFRDQQPTSEYGQSFRNPSSHYQFGQHPTRQSFLASPPTSSSRLGSSHGKPPSDSRSLPPLSSVVYSSLPGFSGQQPPYPISHPPPPASAANILPLPNPTISRRPATSASRPTTAPASYYHQPPGSSSHHLPYPGAPRFGLGGIGTELSIPSYSDGPMGSSFPSDGSSSPITGESPFSFHPPALSEQQQQSSTVPRKRPFPGSDDDSIPDGNADYDYGSESRPQSRRLTVMELLNDTDEPPRTANTADSTSSRFIPSLSFQINERPRTSSGALFSRDSKPFRSDASPSHANSFLLGDRGLPENSRRLLPPPGDGGHLPIYPDSPLLSSSGSPSSRSTISPVADPYRVSSSSPSLVSTGLARNVDSGSTTGESPRDNQVRIASRPTPVGMRA